MTITMEQNGDVMWKLVDQYSRVVVVGPGKRLMVGRGHCDVPLKSSSVDPQHALVEYNNERNCPAVEDMGTENGTFVNDQRIEKREAVLLSHGDKLRFAYDNAVYQVFMCDREMEVANITPSSDQQRLLCRPLCTDMEQLRLSEVRRSSESSFPNGASPQPVCRRRSVQGSDDETSGLDTEREDLHNMEPDAIAPASTTVMDNSLATTFVDSLENLVEKSPSGSSIDVIQTPPPQSPPSLLIEPPGHASPVSPPSPTDSRTALSFTVSFHHQTTSSASPGEDTSSDKEKERKEKDLRSCIPAHVLKTMKQREAKTQQLRERREQEKEEKEKKEKEKKEKKEKEEKERKVLQERRARQEKEAQARAARARSSSAARTGGSRAPSKPATTDSRRRNVAAGAGGGDSAAAQSRSTSMNRSSRPGSFNNGRQRSVSKNRQSSTERGLDGPNSLKTKVTPNRTASTEKRRMSNDSHGDNSLADGKAYILNKLGLTKPAPKSKPVDLELSRAPADDDDAKLVSGSPPSDAGTYTLESDKEKPEKSPRMSMTDDTSALLSQTEKSLHALERNFKNGKDCLHPKRSDTEEPSNRRRHTDENLNVNPLFNVFAGNRTTPSDQGSDAEHSPNMGSSRRPGYSASGLKEHRSAAVRRSNSDTHKANAGSAVAARQNRQLTVPGGPRRRMSSDNTTFTSPRKASNPMSSSVHTKMSSSMMSTSMMASSTSGSFVRSDGGRFSLKQKQEKAEIDKAEALRRRKEYDPRKQADSGRVSRRKDGEVTRPVVSGERPRRTNSADARPVTEGGRPAFTGTRATAAAAAAAAAASASAANTSAVVAPTPQRASTLRRHESLNTGSSGRTVTSRRFQPSTVSLLPPAASSSGSAFLDVGDQTSLRSQSVSNGETSNTEVAYDLLLVSSIQSMTVRLRRGFEELLQKLRQRDIISRSPTPLGELFVAMPPAHFNTTNMELKEILSNLKGMECLYQSLEARLIRDHEEDHPLSSRGKTLGGCSDNEYREEVSRIESEMQGFRPIVADFELDSEPPSSAAASAPVQLIKPVSQRYESSF